MTWRPDAPERRPARPARSPAPRRSRRSPAAGRARPRSPRAAPPPPGRSALCEIAPRRHSLPEATDTFPAMRRATSRAPPGRGHAGPYRAVRLAVGDVTPGRVPPVGLDVCGARRHCHVHADSMQPQALLRSTAGYGGPGRRLPFPLSADPACLDAQQDMKTMAGLSRPAPGTRTSAALGPCASNGQGIQPTQERPTIPASRPQGNRATRRA